MDNKNLKCNNSGCAEVIESIFEDELRFRKLLDVMFEICTIMDSGWVVCYRRSDDSKDFK